MYNGKNKPTMRWLAWSVFVIAMLAGLSQIATVLRKKAKTPPFPGVVAGRQVRWVPDEKVRAFGRAMRVEDVQYVTVFGKNISDPELIAHFRDGFLNALKLQVPRPNDLAPDGQSRPASSGLFAPHYVSVIFKSSSGTPAKSVDYPSILTPMKALTLILRCPAELYPLSFRMPYVWQGFSKVAPAFHCGLS